MRKISLAGLAVLGASILAIAEEPAPAKKEMKGLAARPKQEAVATLTSKSGSQVKGTAVFWDRQGKITLHLTIEGAEPGIHAVHVHETGDCSAADAASAGGHWNPSSEAHGKWGGEHFHRGDIGNVEVGADGKGKFSLFTDKWTIGGAPETDLVGHAVIVHAKADDFTTQPTGNAGGRVACGVIEKKKS